MKDARSSTATIGGIGVAVLVVGLLVWLLADLAALGLALVAVGVAVLVVVAVRRPAGAPPGGTAPARDSATLGRDVATRDDVRAESATRRERADQQRLEDETAATAEDAEQRPPPTGA